jgi:methylglutamate dehydrogenase subunit D
VAEFSLTAQSALLGLDMEKPGIRLTEASNLALVSMAVPVNGEQKLREVINAAFNIALPDIGNSVSSNTEQARFYRLQLDQYFVQFVYEGDSAVDVIRKHVGDAAYLSDQSDSWVAILLSGFNSTMILERICSLDLDLSVFPVGSVARTSMHHLAVIIIREDIDSFMLLSPRSSAESFMHALDVTQIHSESRQTNALLQSTTSS